MSFLRRQFGWMSALVIVALLSSPIARAHCYVLKSLANVLHAAASPPCHEGMTSLAEHAPQPQNHQQKRQQSWSDCPVCLALAVSVAGQGGFAAFDVPDFPTIPSVRLAVQAITTATLNLGGLGSRAPPVLV